MKAQAAPLPAAAVERSLRGGGQPLDQRLRARLAAGLGAAAAMPLREARVHLDADADLAARMLGADAVTVGRHILFRAGAFAPDAADGWALLVHEAAHVVQAATAGPTALAPPIDRAALAELEADAALVSGTVRPLSLAAPALRATTARADPARLAQEVADSLVTRFGADAADGSGRIRQQLIAMAEPFRRDVLRAVQRRLGDGAWAQFLEVIAAPLPPAGLDGSSDAGVEQERQPPAETEEDSVAEAAHDASPAAPVAATEAAIEPLQKENAPATDGPTSAIEPVAPEVAEPQPEGVELRGGDLTPELAAPIEATDEAVTSAQETPSPGTAIPAPTTTSPAAAQSEMAPPAASDIPDEIKPVADADIAPVGPSTPVETLPESEVEPPSASTTMETGGEDEATGAEPTPELEEASPTSSMEPATGGVAAQGAAAIPADILGEFASEPAEDGGTDGAAAPAPAGGGSSAAQAEAPPPPVAAATPEEALAAASARPVAQIGGALTAARAAAVGELAGAAQTLAAEPPTLDRPAVTAPARPQLVDHPITRTRPAQRSGTEEAVAPTAASAPGAPVQVATPAIAGQGDGTLAAADVARVRQAVGGVAVTDPGLRRPVGPHPSLRLIGAADPAGATDARAALLADSRAVAEGGRLASAAPMGEDAIRAVRPAAVLVAPVTPMESTPSQGTAVEAGSRAEAIIADEQAGDGVRTAAQSAGGQIAGAREQRSAEAAARRADGRDAIDQAITADTAEQDSLRADTRRQVADRRGEWRTAEDQTLADAESEGGRLDDAAQQEITDHAADARDDAGEHLSAGEARTEELAQEAEARARIRRDEAAREAEGGVLGWLASTITSFFARLRDALHTLFDAARAAVTRAIEQAQRLAASVIAGARDWIVSRIRAVADAILAVADRLLAALPGLRDRFRALINGLVDAAIAAVTRLAEALTRTLQALLAALGTALRAILSAYELIYGAIIDAVAAAANGALALARTVVAGFGIFAALVGDIAPAPAAWLAKLGAAVSDGIRNHLWNTLKMAVRRWFNDTVQSIVGLAQMIVQVLRRGGIDWRKISRFVWAAIIAALPMIVLQFLITRLIAMIVPAAGAVMLVIQGLMAAWGTISQIMAAVGAFVTFLLAVNGGGAGPLFAAALAASAVALIAFLAQFLLARLRGAAGGIAGRLRALGGRIMAFLRRVGRGVGRLARRAGGALARGARAVGRGVRRGAGRLGRVFGRSRAGRALRRMRANRRRAQQRRRERDRTRDQDRGSQRMQRALAAIRPPLQAMLSRGVPRLLLATRLAAWRIRWRLRRLGIEGNRIVAVNSPPVTVDTFVGDIVRRHATMLNRIVADAAHAILDDPAATAEGNRMAQAEANATAERATLQQRYRNDYALPSVLMTPGAGFVAGVRALRQLDRPSGFRLPHVFYRFLGGNSVVNEQQANRGAGGVFVGPRVLQRNGALRRVNYDALHADFRTEAARRGWSDADMARRIRGFVQSGRGGSGPVSEFARLAFTVESARSASFIAEGPMLMRAVERGDLSMGEAVRRDSPFNPLSPQRAAAANRMFDEQDLGRAGSMRPRDNNPANRAALATIRERRIRLLQLEIISMIRAEGLSFHDDASFNQWATTAFRRHVENQARAFFGMAQLPSIRLYPAAAQA